MLYIFPGPFEFEILLSLILYVYQTSFKDSLIISVTVWSMSLCLRSFFTCTRKRAYWTRRTHGLVTVWSIWRAHPIYWSTTLSPSPWWISTGSTYAIYLSTVTWAVKVSDLYIYHLSTVTVIWAVKKSVYPMTNRYIYILSTVHRSWLFSPV